MHLELKSLKLSFINKQTWLLQLVLVPQEIVSNQISPTIQDILNKFTIVFEKSVGLPPPRLFDHKIVLRDGATSVFVRPYKYTQYQKYEIEKIVKDLLSSGVISPSRPLCLVGQKS